MAIGAINFDLNDSNVLQNGGEVINSPTGHNNQSKILTGFAVDSGFDYKLSQNFALGVDCTFFDFENQR